MSWKDDTAAAARPWKGPQRHYDILKEGLIAFLVISVLSLVLAAVFSSRDDLPVTLSAWAKADAPDFVATALSELAGTSGTAGYGPPYTNTPNVAQKIGSISLQQLAGVTIPIDTATDFVLQPLSTIAPDRPDVATAISQWSSASSEQQTTWTDAYSKGLGSATFSGDQIQIPPGNYGPVQALMQAELTMARGGGLEGALLTRGHFYTTDYTKPLLFLADGTYLESLARAQHLGGDQWGMMNEAGSYPGQTWLWLYTFWYQVRPFSTSGNADVLVWALMMLLTILLALVPWIPGLRSIPRHLKVYKLVWRDYYRASERPQER